jgi:shikimate kinase
MRILPCRVFGWCSLDRYGVLMARVLLTGMAGAGKTAILDELGQRSFVTVDTDYGGWVLPDGTWDESRMGELLARHDDLIVSGTVTNQGRFYDRFHHVVLLSAPLDVLLQRVSHRANPYGRTPEQRTQIAEYVRTVEPLLRRGATIELDGRREISELADAVEKLVRDTHLPA